MSVATANYTLISSDCHAGGNMKAYEEYLAPAYREAFAEWRPVPQLGRRPAQRRSGR
jgi:hypothetical protein